MKFSFDFLKRKSRPRKKLRATAVRRSVRAATADYDDMAEPNMKLSRALFIVLVLHVVAVSGIIAFNAIKTRERPVTVGVATTPSEPAASKPTAAPAAAASPVVQIKRAKPVDDGHKTYVVAKGDNPVIIAKKFHVPYDDLLAANHIDDPRKLKVGQKLVIPNKPPKAKKADE